MKTRTKQKIIALTLAAAMVTGIGATGLAVNNVSNISVSAAETQTTADGFSYEVLDGGKTVKITGYSKNGKIAIPSKIDGKTVVEIGNSAFSGKTGLQSVSIPDTVKTIGEHAFSGCTGMQSVTIPDSVTKIESYAFYNCTALKKIVIPDSVTVIGDYVFYDCGSLETLTVGNSVEKIGGCAFYGCKSLTKVVLPNSLTEIGGTVFSHCTKLETVVMQGENIVNIPVSAFEYCTNLKNVNIGAGVTTISSSAFSGCTSLEEITLPSSVTKIESYAFYNCTALKKIVIPDSVTVIGKWVFNNHSDDLVIYGYTNDCEAKKYADANNITYKLINAHDHQAGEWITVTEATDKDSGTKIQKCTICGELLKVETIPALNPGPIVHTHTFGDEWKSDKTNHWHECTTDDCDEKADVAEHTFGDWIIDKEATDTETGLKHKECTVCGYKGESEIIPITDPNHIHSYGEEWKSDKTNHWHECTADDCDEKADVAEHTFGDWIIDKEATSKETGLKHKKCTVCGYEESEIIPVTDPTPTPTPSNTDNSGKTAGKGVSTGDSALPITIASLLGLGAISAFVITYKKKHN